MPIRIDCPYPALPIPCPTRRSMPDLSDPHRHADPCRTASAHVDKPGQAPPGRQAARHATPHLTRPDHVIRDMPSRTLPPASATFQAFPYRPAPAVTRQPAPVRTSPSDTPDLPSPTNRPHPSPADTPDPSMSSLRQTIPALPTSTVRTRPHPAPSRHALPSRSAPHAADHRHGRSHPACRLCRSRPHAGSHSGPCGGGSVGDRSTPRRRRGV